MWKHVKQNRGKIAGGCIGFLIALLLIIAWPIILMVVLIFLGIVLGAVFDMVGRARKWLGESIGHNSSHKKE